MGKSLVGRIVGAGVAIVIAVVVGFVWNKGREKVEEANAPKVGECVYFKSAGTNVEHTDISCGDAKATYKVAGDDGKCDQAETPYTISLGTSDTGNVADLCLALNANKGDCFEVTTSDAKKVDCASTKGATNSFKVTSVGKAGDKCAQPAAPIENVKRKTLFCMAPNA